MPELNIVCPPKLLAVDSEKLRENISNHLDGAVQFQVRDITWQTFFDVQRQQFNALLFLNHFEPLVTVKSVFLTDKDLFIPIFTHVFGLAKMNGKAAVVSTLRLSPIYYGLPSDPERHRQRVLKEIIHESGHLNGLYHCQNYECVMASSSTADELDIKSAQFCDACRSMVQRKL